ncbi:hypothetical protein [Streptomyces sp. NPDC058595]|uniref:hypothetical protein n=1 Tax=Streptomyces sp. NPDC058595 TaxID=3346550 RepID=UPI0036538AAA
MRQTIALCYGPWTAVKGAAVQLRHGPEGLICLRTERGEISTLLPLLESAAEGDKASTLLRHLTQEEAALAFQTARKS